MRHGPFVCGKEMVNRKREDPMHRNTKLLSILVAAFALALMFAMAGCGQQASSSAASGSSASASTSAANATSASTSAAASSAASSASVSSAASSDAVTFVLKVDATDADKGMLYDGGGTVSKGVTVYQALVDTGLDLKVSSSSGTAYVDGINGVVASETGPNAGWLFTVNGQTPSVGADAVVINDGDEIIWKFTSDYTKTQ